MRLSIVATVVLLICPVPWCNAVQPTVGAKTDLDQKEEQGRVLFERDWKPNPITQKIDPKILPQRGGQNDRKEFKKHVAKMAGDGLGPMHNATSCATCHKDGGAGGIELNVTTLTIDPRSPILAPISFDRFDPSRFARPDDARADIGKELNDLFPALVTSTGSVLVDVVMHERSTHKSAEYEAIRQNLIKAIPNADSAWTDTKQRTPAIVARQPVLAGRKGDVDFYLSQRNSPPLHGLGLLDRIPNNRLVAIARQQPLKTDGHVTGRVSAGRFGWRGQSQTLATFVRGACAGELGLQVGDTAQSPALADEKYVSLGNDLDDQEVDQLTSYIRSLPAPGMRTSTRAELRTVRAGQQIFESVGCADCHVKDISPVRGLYSDLLLHDMGIALQAPSPAPTPQQFTGVGVSLNNVSASNGTFGFGRRGGADALDEDDLPVIASWLRSSVVAYYGFMGTGATTIPQYHTMSRPAEPQFPYGDIADGHVSLPPGNSVAATWDVLQREWRTPPLWGVADSAPYMHDGRAETLLQAIMWHGGEADHSRGRFERLSDSDQGKLLTFLRSLRAPTAPNEIAIEQVATEEVDIVIPKPVQSQTEASEPKQTATPKPKKESGDIIDSILNAYAE